MIDAKQLWVECKCKYRWPICPVPCSASVMVRAGKHQVCPGCGETKAIYILPTETKAGRPIVYELGRPQA